jgi:hypothetical protein
MEEQHNTPVPFIILATGIGFLLGAWYVGLIVGIAMTIIPGVSLIALWVTNNVIYKIPLIIGFPFYIAYLGVRRVFTGRPMFEDESPLGRHGRGLVEQRASQLAQFERERRRAAEEGDKATVPGAWHRYEETLYEEALKIDGSEPRIG